MNLTKLVSLAFLFTAAACSNEGSTSAVMDGPSNDDLVDGIQAVDCVAVAMAEREIDIDGNVVRLTGRYIALTDGSTSTFACAGDITDAMPELEVVNVDSDAQMIILKRAEVNEPSFQEQVEAVSCVDFVAPEREIPIDGGEITLTGRLLVFVRDGVNTHTCANRIDSQVASAHIDDMIEGMIIVSQD